MTESIGIVSTGSYLPARAVPNAVLARSLGIDEEWIVAKTGIRERRVADSTEATSDLASKAGERALAAAGLDPVDLDLIVVATSSPDWIQPATACAVQANLSARNAPAYDVAAVCTGFLYALGTTTAAMQGDRQFRNALVVAAEVYSRILDYSDKKTCVLFGDGAGAVVLRRVADGYGIRSFRLGADGTKRDLVQIPAGGSRMPPSPQSLADRHHFFRMDGRSVREYVRETFPLALSAVLAPAGLRQTDIDLLIPHQANSVLLKECLESLELPLSKVHFTIERYGNTAAASVPITLDDAVRRGRIQRGDHVLLLAFGGGMTWGSALIRWQLARSSNAKRGARQCRSLPKSNPSLATTSS